MKILVINGHEKYPYNEGRLNQTLFEEIIKNLSSKSYEIKTTIVKDGYDVEEEKQKFLWADVIIYQMPVYWFSMPAILKKYVELVYEHGVFYHGSEDYGRGGMFLNKCYMLSLTFNAPSYAFDNIDEFFNGKSVDDVMIAIHKLHEYCAMKAIPTYSCHDVVKNPDIPTYLEGLNAHLNKYLS